jgi:hypothetical protein
LKIEGIQHTKEKPTPRHRIALWENIRGIIYAMNETGVINSFGYDLKKAKEFAGLEMDGRLYKKDVRLYKFALEFTANLKYGYKGPKKDQLVIWVEKY